MIHKKDDLKNIVSGRFDEAQMRQKIILNIERKNKMKNFTWRKEYAVAIVCLVFTVVCTIGGGTILLARMKGNPAEEINVKSGIVINKLDKNASLSIEEDLSEDLTDCIPPLLKKPYKIPAGLEVVKRESTYVKAVEVCDNHYVTTYANSNGDRTMRLTVINNEIIKPYNLEGRSSVVAGSKVMFSEFGGNYFVEFRAHETNIGVETKGVSYDEVIALIESIIDAK